MPDILLHVVPHTHWDREWYLTFQQFRKKLVFTVNLLLDILDRDPDFTHFMLDGQTIVLEDYLEIHPEQKERLKKHIHSGRISIGPWYDQPDEFLVSGEALIRNLLTGFSMAEEYGSVMPVGYVPDTFGHIAQLPQILRGFGIESAVFWRGVGSEAPGSEFHWDAPDGSRVLVIRLAHILGYSNARALPLDGEELANRLNDLTIDMLPRTEAKALLLMNGWDHHPPQDGLPQALKEANALLDGKIAKISSLPEFIQEIHDSKLNLEAFTGEWRSSELAFLLPGVLSTRMWIKQENTRLQHLLESWVEPFAAWASTLDMSYPGGLVHQAWKYLLQNHPHDSICGTSIDQVHQEMKPRFAEAEQIGEEVLTDSLFYLAGKTDTEAFTRDILPTLTGNQIQCTQAIIVHNASTGIRKDTVRTKLQINGDPSKYTINDAEGNDIPFSILFKEEKAPYELKMAFEEVVSFINSNMAAIGGPGPQPMDAVIEIDEEKRSARIEIRLAQIGVQDFGNLFGAQLQVSEILRDKNIDVFYITVIEAPVYTVSFPVEVKGPGYATCYMGIRPDEHAVNQNPQNNLSATSTSIENQYYMLSADEKTGRITLTDKINGATYEDLNWFADGGDVGDLYTYCPPVNDQLVDSPVKTAVSTKVYDGVMSQMQIAMEYILPESCAEDRGHRNTDKTKVTIETLITLHADNQRIDFHTNINNTAHDHRLRVLFPLPFSTDSANAEGTFEVRNRTVIENTPENETKYAGWFEFPPEEQPQSRFVDASDGERGLTLINRGLPEYALVRLSDGRSALALTLLRCVEWLSRGDLHTRPGHAGPMIYTPEAQCLGESSFDYALYPHQSTWTNSEAASAGAAKDFNLPLRAIVTDLHSGDLPTCSTMLDIIPSSVNLSAVKQAEKGDGVVVRLYNPLGHAVEATVTPNFSFSKALLSNLKEEPLASHEQEKLKVEGRVIRITINPSQIITILLKG